MRPRFDSMTFSIAFCLSYMVAFDWNLPMFLYYPLHGNLTWGSHPLRGAGPPMAWYGLMADAGCFALLAAIAIPDRVCVVYLRNYLWLFPFLAMLACVYLLRQFFA